MDKTLVYAVTRVDLFDSSKEAHILGVFTTKQAAIDRVNDYIKTNNYTKAGSKVWHPFSSEEYSITYTLHNNNKDEGCCFEVEQFELEEKGEY